MFKVDNRDTRTISVTPSGVFYRVINLVSCRFLLPSKQMHTQCVSYVLLENVSHLFLVFQFLTSSTHLFGRQYPSQHLLVQSQQ